MPQIKNGSTGTLHRRFSLPLPPNLPRVTPPSVAARAPASRLRPPLQDAMAMDQSSVGPSLATAGLFTTRSTTGATGSAPPPSISASPSSTAHLPHLPSQPSRPSVSTPPRLKRIRNTSC